MIRGNSRPASTILLGCWHLQVGLWTDHPCIYRYCRFRPPSSRFRHQAFAASIVYYPRNHFAQPSRLIPDRHRYHGLVCVDDAHVTCSAHTIQTQSGVWHGSGSAKQCRTRHCLSHHRGSTNLSPGIDATQASHAVNLAAAVHRHEEAKTNNLYVGVSCILAFMFSNVLCPHYLPVDWKVREPSRLGNR
jgi:hypothetical protein